MLKRSYNVAIETEVMYYKKKYIFSVLISYLNFSLRN